MGGSAPDPTTTGRPRKWVKIAVRRHKAHRGEGSSRRADREKELEVLAEDASPTYHDSDAASKFDRGVLHPTLAKDLYTLLSKVLIARAAKQIVLMALLDRVHDSGLLVTHMGNRASLLKVELEKLRSERDPKQLALARQENKSLKAELQGKSISDYKQSVGFRWGLRRMGQVSYEYRYRVALARFQARYPDLEIDNDPFIEQPETHQEFDDSVPPRVGTVTDKFCN
ncbi:hypothetical protein BHE74_00053012 [Ensete ventricosum]|nr:hypothetical protein BHE74_00053012 [Ensete ventricosum]